MTKFTVLSMLLVGVAAQASASDLHIVDFEDLSGQGAVPSNHAGFQSWGSFEHYDWSQSPYNPHSGTQRVYSYGDNTIDVGYDVKFEGAWFAGNYEVGFDLYNDGLLVHQSVPVGLSDLPVFAASGYTGLVDKVVVKGTVGQFVMDDFTYRTEAVPEPASMAALGLGALGILKRRKRSA